MRERCRVSCSCSSCLCSSSCAKRVCKEVGTPSMIRGYEFTGRCPLRIHLKREGLWEEEVFREGRVVSTWCYWCYCMLSRSKLGCSSELGVDFLHANSIINNS